MVRSNELGAIRYCRVSHAGLLSAVRFVLDGSPGCVVEVDPSAEGAVLLGARATLVLDAAGYRLFRREV